ncbi:MAG: hypothetical protein ACLQVG_29160 [Terriglobia bacterium]
MHLRRKRFFVLWLAIAFSVAIIVAAVCPITTLETPRWDVWVVDEKGQPLAGMTVRIAYRNYSAEFAGGEQDLPTDAAGHVVFPARTITATGLIRLLATLDSAKAGVHASFGPHVYVLAFGEDRDESPASPNYVTDWTGKPDHMASHIILKPSGGG